jgi:capsular polysaccharide biosynthesis protein
MELADFLNVIWRWKWLVLAVVILVTGYVLATSLRQGDTYTAQVSVIPGLPQIASASSAGINIEQAGDRIGATYAELVYTEPVLEKSLAIAGLDWKPDALRGLITTEQPKNTPMVKISVLDNDPGRAQILANAVGQGLVDYVKEASRTGSETAKAVIMTELTDIEKQYAIALPGGSKPDENTARALEDRRQSILKNYETFLSQQASGADIQVSGPADTYSVIGNQITQKVLIAFVISLAIGISLAFVAQAISNSLNYEEED